LVCDQDSSVESRAVTATSAAADRYSAWEKTFELYGYEPERFGLTSDYSFQFVRARRPAMFGLPEICIDVEERWRPGIGPWTRALWARRTQHGAYLWDGKAHAQIEPEPVPPTGKGARRIDVDERKSVRLTVHEHPFGQVNDIRVPLHSIVVPDQFLNELETLAAQIAGV
jgi:hypothetical protein